MCMMKVTTTRGIQGVTTQASPTSASPRQRALLLFDGQCPFCLKSVGVLRRLDWLGKVQFQNAREQERVPRLTPPLSPERLLEEMHLVTADQKQVYHGFGAFRWLAWRLPLFWLIAPVLYVPGIPWLGQRIYLWIARHRFQLVPCKHGVCRLPPRPMK